MHVVHSAMYARQYARVAERARLVLFMLGS